MPSRPAPQTIPPNVGCKTAKPAGGATDADEVVAAFTEGELDRQTAMSRLGLSYGELIDAVAARGLRLPMLPEVVRRRMARIVADAVRDEPLPTKP